MPFVTVAVSTLEVMELEQKTGSKRPLAVGRRNDAQTYLKFLSLNVF